MAGLFFDNIERQGRLKDLYGSFNDIRQEISDTIAMVVSEGAELKKALELLQGKGKFASMEELQAKAKAQMTDAEYQEFKDLLDKVEKTDHDLWVAWSVMMWVDAGYALVMLPLEITSRIGAFMVGRALNQAVNAGKYRHCALSNYRVEPLDTGFQRKSGSKSPLQRRILRRTVHEQCGLEQVLSTSLPAPRN
ncbi:hypothetical protein M413DRAFT_321464 [Hebeloma cylindrosporum]|uniref:Uncharacterized protein n=1 Tax=Hebeloma cylindrosporum TaxID=76867 RepID=A0A0C3BH45_HEBCY|nr:hypothetical protein M413DRAFT_321464 [Hebeloma cylindrosporum h7]